MMVAVENLRSRFNSALGPGVPGILRVVPGAAGADARPHQRTATGSPRDGSGRAGRRDRTAPQEFARHRDLLFTVAYEITGSIADAEDVVQESYLRWAEVTGRRSGQAVGTRGPTWRGSPPGRR